MVLSGDTDLTIPYPRAMWAETTAAMLGGTSEEVPEASRDAFPLEWGNEESNAAAGGGPARSLGRRGPPGAPNGDHFTMTWWSMMGPWILTSLRMHLHPEQ